MPSLDTIAGLETDTVDRASAMSSVICNQLGDGLLLESTRRQSKLNHNLQTLLVQTLLHPGQEEQGQSHQVCRQLLGPSVRSLISL